MTNHTIRKLHCAFVGLNVGSANSNYEYFQIHLEIPANHPFKIRLVLQKEVIPIIMLLC